MPGTARKLVGTPIPSRPSMKGYGVPSSMKGALPWKGAVQRLTRSHNYLLISVRPNGAPHAMPVWGVWLDGAFYFSTAETSRKARNLRGNPQCVVCTEKAEEAVIVEGRAERMADEEIPRRAMMNYQAKYGWKLDPKQGPVIIVKPQIVFAMPEKQFPKGVTRWRFE